VLEGSAAAAASARLFYGRGPDVEECPDEAGLRRAIADRVGYDPIFPFAPNDIEVSITRSGQTLVAEAKFVDADRVVVGARTFRAAAGECDELVGSIALSVAIALDRMDRKSLPAPSAEAPAAAAAKDPPATAPEASAAPAPAPSPAAAPTAPVERPAPVVASPPSADRRLDLAAGMAAWIGTAPAPSFGPTVLVSLRWKRFDFGVEGRWELPSSATERGLGGTGEIRTSLVGGGPVACSSFDPYFACAIAFLGSLQADAPGVPGAVSRTGVDVLAGIRGGTAVRLGPALSLRLSLDVLAEAYSPTVRVTGTDAWHPSPVSAGTQIALAWRIL
jgi:hypothetical protein